MNIIIALRGRGGSGKTETIGILHNLLSQNGFDVNQSNFKGKGDFVAIFKKKGILIGVTSTGDSYDLVHKRLIILMNKKCNICICACRTYDRIPPGTNAAILEFKNYSNQFIEKKIDNNQSTQSATNRKDAFNLLNIIDNLI